MWEELGKAPVTPLLIVGAFDLFPRGSWVNESCGTVRVAFLDPIQIEQQGETTRDQFMLLVRKFLDIGWLG
jgi:1-acyl-sn-glycerol-3-phosphate acyltransferase